MGTNLKHHIHPTILHLSHSDARCDARILREVSSLRGAFPEHRFVVAGVHRIQDVRSTEGGACLDIRSLRLACGRAKWVGRHVRRALCLLELALRMIVLGIRLRPVIVHCHDTVVLPAAWVISVLMGSRLVYDAHELESDCNPLMPSIGRLALFAERWCWRQVSLLVSVSQPILDWYRDNLGEKRSVLILNSPIALSPPSAEVHGELRAFGSPGYFHDRFAIPAGTPVFIYVGYLVAGRGIESTLRAFGSPNIKSHVVFMGSGDLLGVEDHAKRFPNIHIHPVVPHEEVCRYVREADCGLCLIEDVSLSDRLCLPNKLFEYAFAGVPVLASRLPEIARVVHQYGLGACCDNDVDSIEAAVLKIEREGFARPVADLTELSWDTQSERLQEAYRQLLSDRGAAVPNNEGDC